MKEKRPDREGKNFEIKNMEINNEVDDSGNLLGTL